MDPIFNVKGGPFQPQPRWIQQAGWRRQTVKFIALVTALALGYLAFLHLSHSEGSVIWRVKGHNGKDNEHKSEKGSQFLLGVGKADITGLRLEARPYLIEY
jgi:neutral ceramidase